ncbi:MAG: hypothetical protein MJZ38_05585 [archaeon]|nr:hypothetical protein [archaeon]
MCKKTMILDALDGRELEHAPAAVFTQTGTLSQMDACGAAWPEANRDAELMARLALEFPRRYGFPTVKVPFCLTIMPEVMGAVVDYGTRKSQPMIGDSPFRNGYDFTDIPDFPSFEEVSGRGRIGVILDALRIIGRDEEHFRIAGMEDGVELVAQLFGMEDFLMAAMMDEESTAKWVGRSAELLSGYARVLSEEADDVQIVCEAAMDILTPEMFQSFSAPNISKLVGSVRNSYCTLHVCGDTQPILEDLASLGESGLSVETMYDQQFCAETVLRHTRLLGGISPVEHLMFGDPGIVRERARTADELGFSIITPECGVPPETSDANLQALADYLS